MKRVYLLMSIMLNGSLAAMDSQPCPSLEGSYTEQEIEDRVFATASPEAQQLATSFTDPDAPSPGALLVGMPGSGKTAFTRALARKTGKELIEIHPDEVSDINRYETDIKLRQRLDMISQSDTQNALIVCDKMDVMFPYCIHDREGLEKIKKAEQMTGFFGWMANLLFTPVGLETRRYEPEVPQFCTWLNSVPPEKKLSFIGIAKYHWQVPDGFRDIMQDNTYLFKSDASTKANAFWWYLSAYKHIDGSMSEEALIPYFKNNFPFAGNEKDYITGHHIKWVAERAQHYAVASPTGTLTENAIKQSFKDLKRNYCSGKGAY